MRVRVSGAASFRRKGSLERSLEEARQQVEALKAADRGGSRRPEAAQARASTTDAEATVMKMGDGGFRPAYNAQYCTDSASRVIVGAEVVTVGSDQGQMTPMLEQVSERCGRSPEQWLGGWRLSGLTDFISLWMVSKQIVTHCVSGGAQGCRWLIG